MDFFEYANIALQFVNGDTLWVPFLVGGLCFAVVFVFEGVALYTIAKREGYKHRWCAFIPFFNTYYIGVCAQKNKCFNMKAKTISTVAASLEVLLAVGFILYYTAVFLVMDYYKPSGDTFVNPVTGLPEEVYALQGVPAELAWAGWCFTYLSDYILVWVNLVFLFFQVMLLSAFFQTYASRRYFLFTLTSVLFPIQGILFFVVRNNKGMNYRDFLRGEQERQYRMYQQYARQNFENDPYNGNPYSRNPYNTPPEGGNPENRGGDGRTAPEDPFSEFGGSSSDPFDDGGFKH